MLQQLARLSASSDALISDMRKTFKSRVAQSDLLLRLSTRYLLVGRCDSRFAGVAKFLPTKVVYAFEHPTHRHVEMHMAYKDMRGVRVQPATVPAAEGELRFRIDGPLAYFTREYDPTDETHDLRIGFERGADVARFRSEVLEHLLAESGGR